MASKFLVGLTAGIIVGILFAPDKGSVTREKIADKASDLKDKFNDFVDSLAGEVDDLTDEATDFASKAKSQFS
jgi:gas vesicle protein